MFCMELAKRRVEIYDCTLREGAQSEGISYSVSDKLKITKALDDFGVSYIEAGNPFSNPKDAEFFARAKSLKLKNAKLCAFGSTRKSGIKACEDENLLALLAADTPVVTIFGKASLYQVEKVLCVSPEENIEMITDSVSFLKSKGKTVFFDAEHFFDGVAYGSKYTESVLVAAYKAGADCCFLCDTRGAMTPDAAFNIMYEYRKFGDIGVHFHNDVGCAVANSLLSARLGYTIVQGTLNGSGERCGNTDLSTLIPTLQLKYGLDCVPRLDTLTALSARIYEVSNMRMPANKPYVGKSAFAHKGGMHIDGMSKSTVSYEHVSPEKVGNRRHFITSEQSGKAAILLKIMNIDPTVSKDSKEVKAILARVKKLEQNGYQFESADASFELLVLDTLGKFKPHFNVSGYEVSVRKTGDGTDSAVAMLTVEVDGAAVEERADGDGPVHALDVALRKALRHFYKEIDGFHLSDYKVRVLSDGKATGSVVRTLIESTDGSGVWTTLGVSSDIIEASFMAMLDATEYFLYKREEI